MIRGASSFAAAVLLSAIVLAPVALRAEDAAQMSVPAAAPADEGMGCPGKADGKPCCAGCETRQRISKGKATGGCPCQQRAREAKEAAEAAKGAE